MIPRTHARTPLRSESCAGQAHQTVSTRACRGILVATLLVVLLVLFWEPFFGSGYLWGPDNLPHGVVMQKPTLPSSFMGRWTNEMLGSGSSPSQFVPSRMFLMVLPPLFFHAFAYAFDVFLLGLVGWYFFRGRGVRNESACIAAIALAFTAHSFTIISAGHMGKFDLMPMAVLMLAALDRAVSRRSLFHFALAGVAAGGGAISQPDVMFTFALLGAAYGLYRLVLSWPSEARLRFVLIQVVGVALAGVCVFAVAGPMILSLRGSALVQREAVTGKTPEEKWEFATNWSMPPEEILEFIAPCVYGAETRDPKAPYWGRLGRTSGWMRHKRGLMNLRGHTVYLGPLQLVLGGLALAAAIATLLRRRRTEERAPASRQPGRNADTIFWTGALVVSALLALGRHFPLYRAFYALPYASSMRAPVKFMHLAEVAVAVLFAFGLDILFERLAGPADEREGKADGVPGGGRMFTVASLVSGGLGAAMLLGSVSVGAAQERLVVYWTRLGMAAHSALLMRNMRVAMFHGAVLFALVAALLWVVRRPAKWLRLSLVFGLLLAVTALDLLVVDRRYVRVREIGPLYADSVVIEKMRQEQEPFRLSNPFPQPPFPTLTTFTFRRHGIDVVEPPPGTQNLPDDYREFYGALQKNSSRLWQLTNARFVIGPADRLRPLLKHPGFKLETLFDIDNTGRIVSPLSGGGRFALARFLGALPRAAMYYTWQSLDQETVLAKLASPQWRPSMELLVTDGPPSQRGAVPTAVRIARYAPQRVEVEVTAAEPGILLLNDKFDPKWRAFVDGEERDILRCNYVMRGVPVEAGEHRVVFLYQPYKGSFACALATVAILGFWFLGRTVVSLRGAAVEGPW